MASRYSTILLVIFLWLNGLYHKSIALCTALEERLGESDSTTAGTPITIQKENSREMGSSVDRTSQEESTSKSSFPSPTTLHGELGGDDQLQDIESSSEQLFKTKATPSRFFTVEELQRLLSSLDSDLEDENRSQAGGQDFDDRTLLDIFGEVAKEYLTQKVIPETEELCKWDWRSLQCEPACECDFQPKLGDYHLGRSCRLRLEENKFDQHCPFVDPEFFVEKTTMPHRVWWLLRRTWKGVRRRSEKGIKGVVVKSAVRLSKMQHNVCSELWTMLYHQDDRQTCWPANRVPIPTIPERVLCGPIHFPICEQEEAGQAESFHRRYYADAS